MFLSLFPENFSLSPPLHPLPLKHTKWFTSFDHGGEACTGGCVKLGLIP